MSLCCSSARCHCSSVLVFPHGLPKGCRHQGPGSRHCSRSWLQTTNMVLPIAMLCISSLKPQWHLSSLLICSDSFCPPALTLSPSHCGSSATALEIMSFGANSKTLCSLAHASSASEKNKAISEEIVRVCVNQKEQRYAWEVNSD